MFKLLISLLRPLPEIAKQLRRIADLYELELAERVIHAESLPAPIRLFTEKPSDADTEVTYSSDAEITEKPWYKRMMRKMQDLEKDEE